ncbi:alpha-1,6-mannosyltransferase, putative [Candida dubliniensis CD36]|uniref:Glycosyltransferase, putative n=1 Tax=Candida dubliniensis (strain CD36 / ATCC MYA-646 / CBS 7987 / NCPF 3949 / NRRL Y-17841) TaxID=573826 RepID=B9WIL3_CANDC|nr:alpha-1,6-mannosyltransferase, putative [Candida dubliniensis CD36]CAX41078.1 alpha-1,6-mannosyltransferase, putative [Candida dubliniensis CD36]
MSKYTTTSSRRSGFRRHIPLILTFTILGLLLTFFGFSSFKGAKDIQEVISNLPNDKILGLSNILTTENSKNQGELLIKIEKLHNKYYKDQEERLKKIEKQNNEILQEIHLLKSPPSYASIRDKLTFVYPYDAEVRFPAYIWQTWKHGLNDEKFDEKYREGERQWAYKNPGFVHELFNDDTAHTMVKYLYRQIPEVINAFESLPEVILKMDFFRYLILFAKGGVYADIDTYPIQPIPNWIPENVSPLDIGLIVGIENDSNSPNWRSESVRRLQLGQFVMQSKPGHPILREIIAQIVLYTKKLEVPELNGNPNAKAISIMKWTGSGRFTDVVFQYLNDYILSSIYESINWQHLHNLQVPKLLGDILVLPKMSFSAEDEKNPLSFVKHYGDKIYKQV